jgi:acetylornithine deacetylase/succinyl-diaminopimelate desuccinylase-like protein
MTATASPALAPALACPPAVVAAAREHLRALLRLDTTNPPGAEGPAVEYLAQVLREGGLEPEVLVSPKGRPNLVARLQGTGARAPLLIGAHLDVVEADPTRWRHPPFAGVEAEGCLWGRGAIDMKNMAAQAAAILVGLRRAGVQPARDLIFAAVADEEAGCEEGSQFLVTAHPEKVRAEYALGEGGGFSVTFGGRRFYPIMTAEKGLAWVRVVAEGPPGHGSMPLEGSAVAKLARAVDRLATTRLPAHASGPATAFVRALAEHAPLPVATVLRLLLRPRLRDLVLDKLFPDPALARPFAALLANTVSPTVLRAGAKTNVIPGRAEAELDGRTLPGQSAEDLLRELQALAGPDVRFELMTSAPPTETSPDTDLFRHLCATVRRHDPEAIPIPYLCPGFTDAKSWSRLGARCYGFLPLRLPPELRYADLFHGDDERIPLDGLDWGTRVLWDALLGA